MTFLPRPFEKLPNLVTIQILDTNIVFRIWVSGDRIVTVQWGSAVELVWYSITMCIQDSPPI